MKKIIRFSVLMVCMMTINGIAHAQSVLGNGSSTSTNGNTGLGNSPTGPTPATLNIWTPNFGSHVDGEELFRGQVDDSRAFIEISNGSSGQYTFLPLIWGDQDDEPTSLYLMGNLRDGHLDDANNTSAVMTFDARIGYVANPVDGGSAVVNRCLFQFRTGPLDQGNPIMTLYAPDANNVYGRTALGAFNSAAPPTAQLHTDGSVRFQGLTSSNETNVIVADANGNLSFNTSIPVSNCVTNKKVPHYSTGTSAYECGSLEDDGTNASVGMAPGATYTAGMGAALNSGSPSGTIKFDVNGLLHCLSFAVTSDSRFKTNVSKIESALDKVNQLNGVSYDWKKEETRGRNFDNSKQLGFIAQDLAKVLPEAVIIDDQGIYSINYIMLIPVLTEAIKEQQAQSEEKDSKIKELIERIKNIESTVNQCCENTSNKNSNVESNITGVARLEQNNPNPFTENTSIQFYIPSNSNKVVLKVYSLAGVELKSFIVTEKGRGQISFSGKTFAAGSYVYALIIDGKQVDSKYMTLTK